MFVRNVEQIVRQIARGTAREGLLIAAMKGDAMSGPTDQVQALLDVSVVLDGAGIPFAVIGGIAVGIQSGMPRATQDIDVAIATSFARAEVAAAFVAAGFQQTGIFPHSLNLRHPNGDPVQVASDPAFDPMIERSESVHLYGRTIRVVTKQDLIAMKERAADDPARRKSKALRDRADVELLRGDLPDPDEGW